MDTQELIDQIDIVEYIGQFIDLQQRGKEYVGVCPFHDDHDPSLSVNQDKQIFKCFVCGVGGSVFNFAKHWFKCNNNTAFNKLSDYLGIPVSERNKRSVRKLSTTSVCEMFAKKRKVQQATNITKLQFDVMERYELNNEALSVWRREGISNETLKYFQVRYDPWDNRLVYPIRDSKGKIVNIGGRSLDPCYKEKGLRKYTYYSKWGSMAVIYGLWDNYDEIVKKQEILIFEGCKSVLIAHTWGVRNTGALLTSHMNEHQLNLLIQLRCKVVFCLDKDVDIHNEDNIKKLKRYTEVYYLDDFRNQLDVKDSPVDKGWNVFQLLYKERKRL